MEVIRLITGPVDVNTYIAYKEDGGECFIVDPSDTEWVVRALNEHGLKPTHILLTHGHFDHVLSVADLQKKYGAKVAIHALDADILNGHDKLALYSGIKITPCAPDILLEGGEVLECAGYEIDVLPTPGHTPGGVCYLVESERVIFSGDTLFRLSVGRSDFVGGDAKALISSIKNELFTLEGDYTVYPGHMDKTSLDYERHHNPFAGGGD